MAKSFTGFGIRLMGLFSAAILSSGISPVPPVVHPSGQTSLQHAGPSTEDRNAAREREILARLTEERSRRRIGAIAPSAELNRLALQQSRDMAVLKTQTHQSAAGRDYEARLAEAGFFFSDVSEITAFLNAFEADALFRVFLENPQSAADLANPVWDRVGIGITEVPNHGFYIVLDFIRDLEREEAPAARTRIQEQVNQIRLKHGLSPIVFGDEKLEAIAQNLAMSRVSGIPFAWDPGEYGEAQAFCLSGTGFQLEKKEIEDLLGAEYQRGGTGIWFGRTPEYPGGAYLFSFILIPRNRCLPGQ